MFISMLLCGFVLFKGKGMKFHISGGTVAGDMF